jgi:hypothetical protein
MRIDLNQNIQVLELTLPASGSSSAPVVGQINAVDPVLIELWIWAGAAGAYARLLDVEANVAPVFGFLPLPTSALNLELERDISGPPWIIQVHAYNPVATETKLYVIVAVSNRREKDQLYQILKELEARIPEPIGR